MRIALEMPDTTTALCAIIAYTGENGEELSCTQTFDITELRKNKKTEKPV